MTGGKSFSGFYQEKNKRGGHRGQDSVLLCYYRKAKGKNLSFSPHTLRKDILRLSGCLFLLKNTGIWNIMEIDYCVWRK